MDKVLLPSISSECSRFLRDEYQQLWISINKVSPSYNRFSDKPLDYSSTKNPSFVEFRKYLFSKDSPFLQEANIFFGAMLFVVQVISQTTKVYRYGFNEKNHQPIFRDDIFSYKWIGNLGDSFQNDREIWGEFSLLETFLWKSLKSDCNIIEAVKETQKNLVYIVSKSKEDIVFLNFAEINDFVDMIKFQE